MKFKHIPTKVDENIEIGTLFTPFLRYWKYFLIIGVITFIISGIYLIITPSKYRVDAKMQLVSQKSGMTSEIKMLKSTGLGSFLGGSSSGINIEDEVSIIMSRAILGDVIKKMNLQVVSLDVSSVKKHLYYLDEPFKVTFSENFLDTISTNIKIEIKKAENESTLKISSKVLGELEFQNVSYPFNVKIPNGGSFTLSCNPLSKCPNGDYEISILNFNDAYKFYSEEVKVLPSKTSSDILLLNIGSENKKQGVDFINNLMASYEQYCKNIKINEAEVNARFVKDKLSIVSVELDSIEREIEKYKVINKIPDLAAYGQVTYLGTEESNKSLMEIKTQRKLMEYVLGYLKNPKNKYSVSPTLGISGESLTDSYNKLIFERFKLLKSSEISNPSVELINDQLNEQRKAIVSSIGAGMKTLDIKIKAIEDKNTSLKSKLTELPENEKVFVEMKRQQKVKETLFLFLLQKLEEKEILNSPDEISARVIEQAYFSNKPVSPQKSMVFLASIFISILFSIIFVSVKIFFIKKTASYKELYSKIKCPILTDVDDERSFVKLRNLITQGDVRLLGVSSLISGEGKTFFAESIAKSISVSGNKVFMINLKSDSSSRTINEIFNSGKLFTNSIINCDGVNMLSFKVGENDGPFLHSESFNSLLDYAKKEYDYQIILFDSIMENSLCYDLSNYVDKLAIVCKPDYTLKSSIKDINELFESIYSNSFAVINTKE